MRLRQLTTIDEFLQVTALERDVWGYTSSEDAVPVPLLVVSVKIGGLVIGAFEDDQMIGFAYSVPGLKDGRPFHWSHMTGVDARVRGRGVGRALKLEQRRLVLTRGMDLIEWTYDPLQALNAHLNFVALGVVVNSYERDVYGESSSPLHRGTATDRFVVDWWLRSSRVEEKLEARRQPPDPTRESRATAVCVNETCPAGEWLAPVRADLWVEADDLDVVIPIGFTEMQQQDLPLARAWRDATREIFEAYLPRGYRIVDFALERPERRGIYRLRRDGR